MVRSFAVFALAFAGLWVLAGAGWALVAAAFLVFALWPQGAETAVAAWQRRAARFGRDLARRAAARPRKAVGVGGMAGGVALLPAGLVLSAGAGVGVAVAGGLLIGVALLTGWGA
jgi:hypothetical protein